MSGTHPNAAPTDAAAETRDPSQIMQVGMGFWPSKALLSAVELGLFTLLSSGALSRAEIAERLGLGSRAVDDFLDGLVALRLLERDGLGERARYRNTPDTAFFLDRSRPSYIGGILEMANDRLYGFWGGLTEALQTGRPQNEIIKLTGASMFEELYGDPARLEQFMQAMVGISMGNFHALAEKFGKDSQLRWIACALSIGVPFESFAVVHHVMPEKAGRARGRSLSVAPDSGRRKVSPCRYAAGVRRRPTKRVPSLRAGTHLGANEGGCPLKRAGGKSTPRGGSA